MYCCLACKKAHKIASPVSCGENIRLAKSLMAGRGLSYEVSVVTPVKDTAEVELIDAPAPPFFSLHAGGAVTCRSFRARGTGWHGEVSRRVAVICRRRCV
jgi:hypothetical protein